MSRSIYNCQNHRESRESQWKASKVKITFISFHPHIFHFSFTSSASINMPQCCWQGTGKVQKDNHHCWSLHLSSCHFQHHHKISNGWSLKLQSFYVSFVSWIIFFLLIYVISCLVLSCHYSRFHFEIQVLLTSLSRHLRDETIRMRNSIGLERVAR
jgi:hypothetical protein